MLPLSRPAAMQLVNQAAQMAWPAAKFAGLKFGETYLTYWAYSKMMGSIFTIDPSFFDNIAKGLSSVISEAAWTTTRTWVPTLIATGFVTAGLPLIYQYVQKVLLHNVGKPPLALKQHKITYLSQFQDKINEKLIEYEFMDPAEELAKPIFKKEIDAQIDDIIKATNNIKRNNAFFQNLILYGPGGTGKTMIAEKIAKEAGMNYIMMSGGELGQFIKRGEHVTELNKLLNAAENASNPTIIFIDEAESLCKNRNKLDQEHLELQNALLNRTGTPSKNVMVILATNRIADIDKAILNRMTHKIHIGLPGPDERAQIIDMYANHFFEDEAERKEFFNTEKIQKMARKTEDLSGRSLFHIINMIFARKGETDNNRLTQQIIDRSIDQFVKQEQELLDQVPEIESA
jgi:AAA+ superfamily predicted ATPase